MDLTSPFANMSASFVLTTGDAAEEEESDASDVPASAAEVPESAAGSSGSGDFPLDWPLADEAVAAGFTGAGAGFSG